MSLDYQFFITYPKGEWICNVINWELIILDQLTIHLDKMSLFSNQNGPMGMRLLEGFEMPEALSWSYERDGLAQTFSLYWLP